MPTIPYPAALDRAAIRLDSLNKMLDSSLVIGNGDVNALVYGDPEHDSITLHLTKNDVWDARIDMSNDPPIMTNRELKELMRNTPAGETVPQRDDSNDSYHAHGYPCPRIAGFLRVSADVSAADQEHVLDLKTATATCRHGETTVRIRAQADRNVFVIESGGPLGIALAPADDSEMPDAVTGADDTFLWLERTIPGDLDIDPLTFAVAVCREHAADGCVAVAIATSKESEHPLRHAKDLAQRAATADRSQLRLQHEAAWADFWSVSGIELPATDADAALLEALWYRSLYWLRCVSKPGVTCPGLYASLVDNRPPWHGDFHTNYNIQQTFWACYAANHADLAEPYNRLIADYLPRARWIARNVYECDGAYYPHVLYADEPPDPDRCASRNGRQYFHHVWARTLGVAPFSVQPLVWYWRATRDAEFLRETGYPAVHDVAVFCADFMRQVREQDGSTDVYPTVSPEHWNLMGGFDRNRNGTFDIAMFAYIFRAASEMAEALGVDADLCDTWKSSLAVLPDYPTVGESGDEVVVDVEGAPVIEYNIPVPATPVFPGDEITAFSDPVAQTLLRRSMERLTTNGNNSTAILCTAMARLDMTSAFTLLVKESRARMRPNGSLTLNRIETGHKFNEYGHYTEQFGYGLPISELLLQSVGGTLRLFPAWPREHEAAFASLRTEGGFLVSARLVDGNVADVEIHSTVGGVCRLVPPWPGMRVVAETGDAVSTSAADGIAAFETQAGCSYRVEPVA